jgi:hypothetical protein
MSDDKTKGKTQTGDVSGSASATVEVAPPVTPVEDPVIVTLNMAPFKRLIQYLGVVSPGVDRILMEMLTEHELKITNMLSGVGIKFS